MGKVGANASTDVLDFRDPETPTFSGALRPVGFARLNTLAANSPGKRSGSPRPTPARRRASNWAVSATLGHGCRETHAHGVSFGCPCSRPHSIPSWSSSRSALAAEAPTQLAVVARQ